MVDDRSMSRRGVSGARELPNDDMHEESIAVNNNNNNKIHVQTNTESVQCLPVKYHK